MPEYSSTSCNVHIIKYFLSFLFFVFIFLDQISPYSYFPKSWWIYYHFTLLALQYIQPHEHEKLSQVELLVIDEAAAIPLPVVKSLLGPYLVFLSSTVNGYVMSVWFLIGSQHKWSATALQRIVISLSAQLNLFVFLKVISTSS